jgi:hypothetical protein
MSLRRRRVLLVWMILKPYRSRQEQLKASHIIVKPAPSAAPAKTSPILANALPQGRLAPRRDLDRVRS